MGSKGRLEDSYKEGKEWRVGKSELKGEGRAKSAGWQGAVCGNDMESRKED